LSCGHLLPGNVRGGDGAGWVGAFLPVDPGGAGGVDVGVDRGADGGEEAVGADGLEQAVAVQAVLDRALELGEGEGHLFLAQLVQQLAEGEGGVSCERAPAATATGVREALEEMAKPWTRPVARLATPRITTMPSARRPGLPGSPARRTLPGGSP
jgi:hypothetical protein